MHQILLMIATHVLMDIMGEKKKKHGLIIISWVIIQTETYSEYNRFCSDLGQNTFVFHNKNSNHILT